MTTTLQSHLKCPWRPVVNCLGPFCWLGRLLWHLCKNLLPCLLVQSAQVKSSVRRLNKLSVIGFVLVSLHKFSDTLKYMVTLLLLRPWIGSDRYDQKLS